MITITKDCAKEVATVSIEGRCEIRVMPLITHNGGRVFALVDIYREKKSPYVTTSTKWQKYADFDTAIVAAIKSVKQTYEVSVLGMRWRDCYTVPERKISCVDTLHPYFAQ